MDDETLGVCDGSLGKIMNFEPLRLRPCYKEYIWGGECLKKEYGKHDAPDITAESWELAAHPDGISVVAEGALAGKSLKELGKLDRVGFWGNACRSDNFPILVKLIDAARDLSIQVHPSDITANTDIGEQGKAEMWYIVDCEPQSCIYLGLSEQLSREDFFHRAADGSICEVLNRVPVQKGDVFYILPGTIHAICSGIVIAEIQQNSNTTFRIYDYDRRDASGAKRPLHLNRAAEVLDYEPLIPSECRANNTAVFPEFTMTEMFSCPYFKAFRLDVRTEVRLSCNGDTFRHLLCVEGTGQLISKGTVYPLRRGDSFFLPAALGEYQIQGACRVLLSGV